MRKILFRGKTEEDKWVYGVPVIGKYSGIFIVWVIGKTKGGKGGIVIGDKVMQAEVIPETVGQFTGLNDKNGEKIFEGDIVVYHLVGRKHIVVYDPAIFRLADKEGNFTTSGYPDWDSLEVIGNVADNPELLEKTK